MMTQSGDRFRQQLPLTGQTLTAPHGSIGGYAARLLASLGATSLDASIDPVTAQIAWARSGAMMLTGRSDGPPLACPAPLAACMQAAFDALQTLSPNPVAMDATALLGERAAIAGHQRRGHISPGGSCRLLAAADGFVALNLARDDDWSLLPALLDGEDVSDWQTLATVLRAHNTAKLCDKAQLLGLALTLLDGEPCERGWFEITATGAQGSTGTRAPLVVDLSSLWAGPLCAHLLLQAGARVIKVESLSRPDGARRGPPAFFDLLNAGKQSIAVDLATPTGVAQLRALLNAADIVIESARPRALQQLGILAEELVASRKGLTWVSITGYGRTPAQAMRIAYGDDAGVAAGLSAQLLRQHGAPVFCGDAIADPLTGAHAALAAMAGWTGGGGYLLDVALQPVVNYCLRAATIPCGDTRQRNDEWILHLNQQEFPVLPPRARPVTARAQALGADTAAICREFALPC